MSRDLLHVRPATARDADAFVAVVRGGFEPAFAETTTYGCHGMAQFVRDQIALPASLCDSRYTVAVAGETVAGAVDLRADGRALVLNYIAVDSRFRSGGLARRLLAEAVEAFPQDGLDRMALDVLATNDAARRWYERLGFERESETQWWALAPHVAGQAPGGGVVVHAYPQAQASQTRFGFSQFDVATPAGRYPVGRLGAAWFRLTDDDAHADPAMRHALGALDPHRRLLVLLRGDEARTALPGATLHATTLRLQVPLADLRARLATAL